MTAEERQHVAEIAARAARLPKLYVPADDARESSNWEGVHDQSRPLWPHTVSDSPDLEGWRTDGGCNGYGLPEVVATGIVALQADVAWLLAIVQREAAPP